MNKIKVLIILTVVFLTGCNRDENRGVTISPLINNSKTFDIKSVSVALSGSMFKSDTTSIIFVDKVTRKEYQLTIDTQGNITLTDIEK